MRIEDLREGPGCDFKDLPIGAVFEWRSTYDEPCVKVGPARYKLLDGCWLDGWKDIPDDECRAKVLRLSARIVIEGPYCGAPEEEATC